MDKTMNNRRRAAILTKLAQASAGARFAQGMSAANRRAFNDLYRNDPKAFSRAVARYNRSGSGPTDPVRLPPNAVRFIAQARRAGSQVADPLPERARSTLNTIKDAVKGVNFGMPKPKPGYASKRK